MFKNLTLLRLPRDYDPQVAALEETLAEHQLRDPGPLELETRGFVSPYRDAAMICTAGTNRGLLAMGVNQRLLPASVLRAAVDARIADHVVKTGRKPGKRLRNDLRDAALVELLPRAFVKHARTSMYYEPGHRLLCVDTTSDRTADAACSLLRDAIGSFPACPLAAEASISLLMSQWLISGELPAGFELGDEVELKDPSDKSVVVRGRHHDLTADEIIEHARCGKQVTQLGLIFDGRISFVLDAKLKIRKLSFLDVVAEQLDAGDTADANAMLDAEFFLMSAELARLFDALDRVLRFED